MTAASSQKLFWYPCRYNQSQKWQIGDATEPPSDDDPTSEPTPSLCAVKNCVAPGACLLIDDDDYDVDDHHDVDDRSGYNNNVSINEIKTA